MVTRTHGSTSAAEPSGAGRSKPLGGLSDEEAARRLSQHGPNEPTEVSTWETLQQHIGPIISNPLVLLLLGLGGLAYVSGDANTAHVIWAMMALAVGMQMFQEFKGEQAAAKLKNHLQTTCNVLRGPTGGDMITLEARNLVPGDVVLLSAGDVIPADGFLVQAIGMCVNQSRLTGESIPSHRSTTTETVVTGDSLLPEHPHVVLSSSMVVAGSGAMQVLYTGDDTMIGKVVGALGEARPQSRFEKDMESFTWMMIRFIFILAPVVLTFQVVRQGLTLDAFMYAVSVSVGLSPEMLPMILTACLVHGASSLSSRHKCIVKRLNAMQAFGTMDVLCTDKTGTLTEDSLCISDSLDGKGQSKGHLARLGGLALAKLNAEFQQLSSNAVEKAIRQSPLEHFDRAAQALQVLESIPFNFETRVASVTVRLSEPSVADSTPIIHDLVACGILSLDHPLQVVKGAVEEIVGCAEGILDLEASQANGRPIVRDLDPTQLELDLTAVRKRGDRIIAVAVKLATGKLALTGFITFEDPPKASAAAAVASMDILGVEVKMLTGDTSSVAAHVASKVGIHNAGHVIEGATLEKLGPEARHALYRTCNVFARLSPSHKQLVITELKEALGKSVGFVGDGVNDVAALQAADVGISVDSACDAARSAADILLTRKDLNVLEPAVLAGRRVFLNMVKYLKMAASSNFGNMFSVVGASAVIPFIPMLPIQVVTSNFLYDLAQLGIPSDTVECVYLRNPLRLNMMYLQRFIVSVGFISSVFDFVTFATLWYCLGANSDYQSLFHTGWFVEGLMSQTLIVFVLRSEDPFAWLMPKRGLQLPKNPHATSPGRALILLSLGVCTCAGALTFVPFVQEKLMFVMLPLKFWAYLTVILVTYMVVTYALIGRIASDHKLLSVPKPTRPTIPMMRIV